MGTLKPTLGNANYSTSGQLSPLLNDPYYRTLGLGTRIFLAGAQGFITWHGSQHRPETARTDNGIPRSPAGTLMLMGDLKGMNPRWLKGVSILGYGCSLAVGVGVPIPILDEEMAFFTGVSDKDIVTQVKDYSFTRPDSICEVNYSQLRSGTITVEGKEVRPCRFPVMCGQRRLPISERMDSKRRVSARRASKVASIGPQGRAGR